MKLKVLILALFMVLSMSHANSAWTLDSCLKLAKEKSLQLESARLREQQADINIKQAKVSRYPDLSASIQNTLYDHPFVHDEDHYRLNLGLSSSVVLWDGGVSSLNVEAGQLSKEAVLLATKQVERTIQENVLNAFISLLAALENLRTASASVGLAQAEFEHYGRLFEAGSITKKDLTQSQSNVMQKEVAFLSAQLSVNTLKTTLRQLLELPEGADIEIASPDFEVNHPDSLASVPDLQQLIENVKAAHPGLKSDSISIHVAQKNTLVAGKGSSISVTLGANSSTGLQAWESGAYGDQLKYGWQNSLTLGIKIPIIDGGAVSNKVLLAQVNENEAQVSLLETKKALENSIEKLYLNAISADLQWKAAILQVEAETEAMAAAEEMRNAGALTYTDYLNQKNSLELAQVSLINAKYNCLLMRKLLDLYQGKLD